MSPSIQQSLPAYKQVVRYYSERIARGELRPGDKIPSQRELMEEWNISKATANKVVATLKSEGLAETQVGVGTLVAEQQNHSGIGPRDMFGRIRHEGKIRLPTERSERTTGTSETRRPSKQVIAAVGGTPESYFIWRRRVIYRDEQPYSIAISWFLPALIAATDPSITEALLADTPIPQGTLKFIADRLGRSLTEGNDLVSAIPADEEVARDLRIEVGSPVLYVVNTASAEDWPIEVGEYFYPADSTLTYSYEV